MTRIRATCPACGEIELVPSDLLLRRIVDADGEVTEGSCYRFSCPECAGVVEKPADARVAQLLVTGGVPVETLPALTGAEVDPLPPHPEEPIAGPPLTLDDLLDLHLALDDARWFDRLVGTIDA
jgi:predicted RNA-binding Zn-ribbon protein involved in translation (DUF1610 family)